jgi:hypothetical protein
MNGYIDLGIAEYNSSDVIGDYQSIELTKSSNNIFIVISKLWFYPNNNNTWYEVMKYDRKIVVSIDWKPSVISLEWCAAISSFICPVGSNL